MKLLRITLVLAAAGLLFAQADSALQKAIRKETVEGDLKGAIEQYKKLAQDKNRTVAAQALIHMGECYEKLGSKEADKQYELVISMFADQKDAVTTARSRLGAIKTSGMVNSVVWDQRASAVSPDGRYLSFSDRDSEGHEDLMIHDLVTNTDRRLTQASKDESPDESAFSPDVKQIAYIWNNKQGSDLRILSLTGNGMGTPRIFKNQDWSYDAVAWSPDGKWLATYAHAKGKPWNTILVSVQDGSQRELTKDYCLVFSPDGKYLACDHRTSGPRSQENIFIVDTSTGRETPALVLPENDLAWGWSKDGWLLFGSDRNDSVSLYALPVVDGKATGESVLIKSDVGADGLLGMTTSGALYYNVRAGGSRTYLEVAPFDFAAGRVLSPPASNGRAVDCLNHAEYDWSPDGKYLAYVTPNPTLGRSGPAIVIRSAGNGVVRVIQSDGIGSSAQPRWAPDSRTLLVPGRGEIHLIDTQTDEISTFKADGALEKSIPWMPAWSPDQKKIYFAADIEGQVAFFESDPDLKNVREIIRRPNMGGLNLTPDGRTIVTHPAPKGAVTIAIPVAGGEPREIHRAPSAGNIFISPDGKYVALVSTSPATLKLTSALIVPTLGGEVREIFNVQAPLAVGMGMWAPDSKSIFLRTLGPDGQQAEMWRVPVDGGQPMKVDTGLNLDQFTQYIKVSPAGNQIAYIREAGSPAKSEVWALKNFLPARGTK